jgi:hypothetical protein
LVLETIQIWKVHKFDPTCPVLQTEINYLNKVNIFSSYLSQKIDHKWCVLTRKR